MKALFVATGMLVLAVALVDSCGDTACACSPPNDVAGVYHATRLRFTPAGQATVDALAAGATITLTLAQNGSTSGTFFVPAALNNGVQVSFDLAGSYQSDGVHVSFSHTADTFIRDVQWSIQGSTLATTATAGSTQYDVILSR